MRKKESTTAPTGDAGGSVCRATVDPAAGGAGSSAPSSARKLGAKERRRPISVRSRAGCCARRPLRSTDKEEERETPRQRRHQRRLVRQCVKRNRRRRRPATPAGLSAARPWTRRPAVPDRVRHPQPENSERKNGGDPS